LIYGEMIAWRHDLNEHPELGLEDTVHPSSSLENLPNSEILEPQSDCDQMWMLRQGLDAQVGPGDHRPRGSE
jgi:hypothetical protein